LSRPVLKPTWRPFSQSNKGRSSLCGQLGSLSARTSTL
jgi:hypothetical protein